jgi:hypothetical protein
MFFRKSVREETEGAVGLSAIALLLYRGMAAISTVDRFARFIESGGIEERN